MQNQWKMIGDDTVSWAPDWPEVDIEFDIEGKVQCATAGSVLPGWLVDELEVNEAERRNRVNQGDAWAGGFAENY